MQVDKTWSAIVEELARRVGAAGVSTWFSDLKLTAVNGRVLTIESPNHFTSDWIKKNYKTHLKEAASAALGADYDFELIVSSSQETHQAIVREKSETKDKPKPKPISSTHAVITKYTLENFVVGRSNQFAYAACQAVAEKKARNYNPLFIYGGVGLGKTHLLNAVGNRLLDHNSSLKVVCIQAETFMNEMINAIREEKMPEFRNRYRREIDVLLMDDIEIIAGKERTQEEFFYTFNDLYLDGKKIVITSDKFPKEMTTLEERLRSRFESGIIVDIQPPEFETRLDILRRMSELEDITLPDEVAYYMAERVKSNVRKLEGSLIRLAAVTSLSGQPISIDLAEEVIKAVLDDPNTKLSAEDVMKKVAAYFKIKVSDMKSPKRNRKYTLPRQIAMYLCREMCSMSYPEIGSSFGGRDHSTVIHSCRKIGIDKNTDQELERHIEALKRKLAN
jgi:chromosomal replication initiator protein